MEQKNDKNENENQTVFSVPVTPENRRAELFLKCNPTTKSAIIELREALDALSSSSQKNLKNMLPDFSRAEAHVQRALDVLLTSGNKAPVQTLTSFHKELEVVSAEVSAEVAEWLSANYTPQAPHSFEESKERLISRKCSELDAIEAMGDGDDTILDELGRVMDWNNFDVFSLQEKSGGKALSVLAVHLFHHFDLFNTLDLNHQRVTRFWVQIETGYQNNPYHASIHAADVLQEFAWFLNIPEVRKSLTPLEICAGLVSAGIHDYDHPGTNNNFLIRTNHELALRYNNRSVLENHHASAGLQVLQLNQQNFFLSHIDKKSLINFRRLVTSLVLSTDMSYHFQLQTDFVTKFTSDKGKLSLEDPAKRELFLQIILHAADLGNCGKPWVFAQVWGERVVTEFFVQGDKEKQLGLPVSAMNDREKSNAAELQSGFIKTIVLPMFEEIVPLLPEVSILHENAKINYENWRKKLTTSSS
eukprot:c21545_g3_i1.p1 GENE.c21545_g3_i1~~c21545_g3_i1.p1  ORF type:complete len:474 (+),score=162.42 c21545_g3_i1:61-1482(+)